MKLRLKLNLIPRSVTATVCEEAAKSKNVGTTFPSTGEVVVCLSELIGCTRLSRILLTSKRACDRSRAHTYKNPNLIQSINYEWANFISFRLRFSAFCVKTTILTASSTKHTLTHSLTCCCSLTVTGAEQRVKRDFDFKQRTCDQLL